MVVGGWFRTSPDLSLDVLGGYNWTQFRTFLLQPFVITELNFWNSKFALLS